MVQTLSQLNVADNSGATKAKVIKILRPKNKKYGVLGDLVMVAIQKNIPHSKIRKGHIAKAILIRSNVKTSLISHLQT
jgi:large subunit ribosomal protein L14|tara:strand:- start:3491 stop:3724 length:234 start_codon:yes stop_codon:yes gene_type:complete